MRNLLRVATIAIFVGALSCATPEARDWKTFLSGSWGWLQGKPGCEENPHTITFSDDGEYLVVKTRDPVTTESGETEQITRYAIAEMRPTYLRMHNVGETRRTWDGELAVWHLVSSSEDSYCWRRTDWGIDDCTARAERCEP